MIEEDRLVKAFDEAIENRREADERWMQARREWRVADEAALVAQNELYAYREQIKNGVK